MLTYHVRWGWKVRTAGRRHNGRKHWDCQIERILRLAGQGLPFPHLADCRVGLFR